MGTVVIVALLTWGGVFLYLLRLESLTRALEKEVERASIGEEKSRAKPLAESLAEPPIKVDAEPLP
jgi:hypothetical protein